MAVALVTVAVSASAAGAGVPANPALETPSLSSSSQFTSEAPSWRWLPRYSLRISQQDFAAGDASLRARLSMALETALFAGEFRGFHELGSSGDTSVEFPRAYLHNNYEAALGSGHYSGEWWLGRRLPWIVTPNRADLGSLGGAAVPVWAEARSQLWAQNQSEVFDPLSVGWLGAGTFQELPGNYKFSVAYSPLFLPHFGPSVRLSPEHPAEGSRYGNLPPQQVRVGGALFPIRYQVDAGDVRDIVVQNQVYAELNRGAWSLLGWSAPNPEPTIDPDAQLLLKQESSRVLVTARPHFDRQNFAGLSYRSRRFAIQGIYEVQKQMPVLSLIGAPLESLQAGILHRWSSVKQENLTDPSRGSVFLRWRRPEIILRPWAEWRSHLFKSAQGWETLDTSVRIGVEQELIRSSQSGRPSLSLFSTAQLLASRDEAPWASWRSLDYVEVGVHSQW